MAASDAHVRPVLRPVFATRTPAASVAPGSAGVADGGAAAMPVGPAAPRSRIAPERSTAPVFARARAASTLLVWRGAAWASAATWVPDRQRLSVRPGCEIGSPGVPWPDLSRMWLLLR